MRWLHDRGSVKKKRKLAAHRVKRQVLLRNNLLRVPLPSRQSHHVLLRVLTLPLALAQGLAPAGENVKQPRRLLKHLHLPKLHLQKKSLSLPNLPGSLVGMFLLIFVLAALHVPKPLPTDYLNMVGFLALHGSHGILLTHRRGYHHQDGSSR